VFAETLLDDLIALAKERRGGHRLIDNAATRHKLAELKIEFHVGRLLSYRIAWMQGQGLVPNSEASVGKLFSTELQSRFAVTALSLLGQGGLLARGSAHVPADGRFSSYYLAAVSYTIAAGTSEVQRNIIAQRGLGLPRA
jgi:alkylation response protein AidB-like acyl-CoA dehydrogenase